MARQRMYLFERAYVDFTARLHVFFTKFLKTCRDIVGWSIDEDNENFIIFSIIIGIIILIILSILIYQSSGYFTHKLETSPVLMSIFVSFIALLPISFIPILSTYFILTVFATKVILQITSLTILITVALAGSSVAIVTFLPYLLALVLLTALSAVAFLPIRAMNGLSLLYRHITYCCPYDDCGYSGLPIHIYGDQQFPDLQPNFYGVFYHSCRNPDGTEVKLPTLDFRGRKKLDRICGGCKRPLIFSSFGELAEKPIAIVGGPMAGKTVFLCQAVDQLLDCLGKLPGSRVQIDSDTQWQELEGNMQRLQRGQVLAKTVNQTMAFGLSARLSRRWRHLLYLYDAPGEDFLTMQRLGQKQSFQHTSGIILLVDPFSLPGLASHRDKSMSQVVSEVPLQQVVETLLAGVNTLLVKQPTDTCNVPLAVVINKVDALPVAELPFLSALQTGSEAGTEACRQALDRLGANRILPALEHKFTKIKFFSCSALGRMPDPDNASPFQPLGVTEPFLWLLGLEKLRSELLN